MSAAPDQSSAAVAHPGALRHALASMAADASRSLSNRAQAPFELTLTSARLAALAELAAELGALDRVVVLGLGATGEEGFVLLSRPFAFALLALRFGARPSSLEADLPARVYTRIEERTIRRAAEELWHVLEGCAGPSLPGPARVLALEDAGQILARGERRVLLATFELQGLSQAARILLALPAIEGFEESGTEMEEGGNHEGKTRSEVAAKGSRPTPDGVGGTPSASAPAALSRTTDV